MDAQTEPQWPVSPDRACGSTARPLAGWNSRLTDRLLGLAADDVARVTEADVISLAIQIGVVAAP
jgi:hypothetical protein